MTLECHSNRIVLLQSILAFVFSKWYLAEGIHVCKHSLGFSMRFIHCPTAHKVWKYLSKVLRVLTLDPLLFETYTMGLFYSFSYDPNERDGVKP